VSLLRLNSTRLALVERNLERLVEDDVITGGVLGAGDAAGNTWFATCGAVSVDGTSRPTELSHRFLLTSVTKPFTATQILILAEDGLLDLDAPVASYIPEFGAHGKGAVTTRHLLTHTGGLSDTANLVEGPAATRTPDDYIAAALGTGLAFEPGEGWAYSSPGFWVMAELVNRLRGERYTDDVNGRISVPLELENTRYETGTEPPAGLVGAVTQGAWDAHLPEQVRQAAYPAGGLVSTCPDLVRFGQAFLDSVPEVPGLLSSPVLEQLRDCHATGWNMGRPVQWSLGWERPGPGNFQSPRTIFHHGASGVGLWADADHGITVALLTADWWLPYQRYAEVVNSVMGAVRN